MPKLKFLSAGSYFAACRMPHRVEHTGISTFSAFPLMAQLNSQQLFHLCVAWKYYEREARMKNHAAYVLRPAAWSLRPAARRPHGFSCVRTRARVHNTFTQHASEIAGNSIAPLVEMQSKLKYVQLGAACGKVWTGFKSGQPTREWAHSLRRVTLVMTPVSKH